jgi:hypothetical protein
MIKIFALKLSPKYIIKNFKASNGCCKILRWKRFFKKQKGNMKADLKSAQSCIMNLKQLMKKLRNLFVTRHPCIIKRYRINFIFVSRIIQYM